MAEQASFADLMARLQTGEEKAACVLFERFARRLVGLANRRLSGRLQARLDPEDVVQSVFKSFFARVKEGEFDLDNWESLWSLLVVITLRKCGRKIDYFRAACRDVRKEAAPASPADSSASWAGIAREPTPVEAAVLTETLDQVMQGLSEREGQVFELRLQGYTGPEISARVQRSERTVHLILMRIRKRLCQLRDEPETMP